MKTKTAKAAPRLIEEKKPTTKTKEAKPKVFYEWGVAFKTLGSKPNAPKLIVQHMKKMFPNRKTNWLKWVNKQRCEYNGGYNRAGFPAPKVKLPVYEIAA